MRIVVDINHPGHVHMFKNFIWEMQKRGHEILITATHKDVAFKLLDNYGFDYINLGGYGKSLIKKLINLPIIDLKMYSKVKKFNPDVFVGVGSIRAAHVSFLLRKKCIIFEDTEHSTEQIKLYLPFVTAVCTPSCFKGDLGKKQIRYNGYHELAYLHPNYFKPNPEVLRELGLNDSDPYIVMRFVSWEASHDIGQHGIQNEIKLVKELEKYGRVLITSEKKLNPILEKYKINVSPEKLHDLLYYSLLCIGDGGTTASECALLGTPSIYVSSLAGTMGNFCELEMEYGLLFSFKDQTKALNKAIEILQTPNVKSVWAQKKDQLLEDKIDVTSFILNLVSNYVKGGSYESQ